MPQVDNETSQQVINRLRRANGQLTAVIAMIDEGRDCEDVVTQLAAVSKAVDRAAFKMLAAGLQECIAAGEDGEASKQKLERLFMSFG